MFIDFFYFLNSFFDRKVPEINILTVSIRRTSCVSACLDCSEHLRSFRKKDYFVKWTKKFVEKCDIETLLGKNVKPFCFLWILIFLNSGQCKVFLISELSEWGGILTMHTSEEESASGILTPGLLGDSKYQQRVSCVDLCQFLHPCGRKSAFLPEANSSPVKENCNQRS